MNKVTRLLTMAGMGLLASVAIGAGPAQASDTAAHAVAKPATSHSSQAQAFHGRDRIVGYYRSPRACVLAGRIGERFNRWDDFDCDRIRFGFRRGLWALEVEQNWSWGQSNHNSRFDNDRFDNDRFGDDRDKHWGDKDKHDDKNWGNKDKNDDDKYKDQKHPKF